jgi:hypothetical protein
MSVDGLDVSHSKLAGLEVSAMLDVSNRAILADLSYAKGRYAVVLLATESPRSREGTWTILGEFGWSESRNDVWFTSRMSQIAYEEVIDIQNE